MQAGGKVLSDCTPACETQKHFQEVSDSVSDNGWAMERNSTTVTKTKSVVGPTIPATIAASVGMRVLQQVLSYDDEHVDPVTKKDLEFVKYAVEGLMLLGDDMVKGKSHPSARASTVVLASLGAVVKSGDGPDIDATGRVVETNGEHTKKRPKMVHVSRAVMMSIRWRKATQDPDSDKSFDVPLLGKCLGEKLNSWTGFDVFHLHDLTGGHALAALCDTLFWKRGFLEKFPIRKEALKSYWLYIESMYRANPYHCSTHAVDVVHAAHLLLNSGFQEGLTDIETLTILFASAVHDVAHPGVTNDFRIAEGDEDAITYNDQSVNENMSLSISFLALLVPSNNFLESFGHRQVLKIRKRAVYTVLATDMATHFVNADRFREQMRIQGTDVRKWTDKKTLLEAIVHAADLSNPCRNLAVSYNWTSRVLKEFFAQGDRERSLGRPVTALCDRYIVSKPESQIGFISFIVHPYYNELRKLCPIDDVIKNLSHTLQFWTEEREKEKLAKDTEEQLANDTEEQTMWNVPFSKNWQELFDLQVALAQQHAATAEYLSIVDCWGRDLGFIWSDYNKLELVDVPKPDIFPLQIRSQASTQIDIFP